MICGGLEEGVRGYSWTKEAQNSFGEVDLIIGSSMRLEETLGA